MESDPSRVEARPPMARADRVPRLVTLRHDPDDVIFRGSWVIILIITLFSLAMWAATARAETGLASFYWQGKKTANGERFNPNGLTCAHRTRPFGQVVRVTWGSRSVLCRINDRGPFVRGRVIDLSYGAAIVLGIVPLGVVLVRVE